jgi:hypothetical protein
MTNGTPSPYDQLMAEAIPTRPRNAPRPEPPPKTVTPWTSDEQDAHWAELCEAVGTPDAPRPHLRLVETTDETDAA